MESKTIEKLEFNKVLEKVSNYAITYSGKEMVLAIKPLESKEEIEKQVGLVSEASILLYRKGTAPISEIADIKEHLKKFSNFCILISKIKQSSLVII
jgi:DNA mismatch repair protein MutS2